ncbi:MAG: L-erythro-3,5-diaminohexanoate dehydrogenase, partial [Candidatus Eremiobacteraeota bacterium]|nr:L-erythro-3,5-diaminohexanoate dehydrogenase [Candidatus Eremiobacteraeota bacterium]
MSAATGIRAHRLGTHRVLEPSGVMPQQAWRVDNTPIAADNEILCDVDVLNIDSASFKQISDACDADAGRIGEHILQTVRARGKQHNPVTGSGGMFVGRVREIGKGLRDQIALRDGDRIASLVSLSLTPLHVEAVRDVDVATGRVWVTAKAILFESGIWARLPHDIDENVALAVLDVAGAPAQVPRLCAAGQTVVVIGAAGKSGLFSCAQAKTCVGPGGRVIGIVHDAAAASAQLLTRAGLVDHLVEADATDALATSGRVEAVAPHLADVTINCVNVPGTELCSILCTR